MLNKVWLSFFLVSFLSALYTWLIVGDYTIFNAIVESIFTMANLSVEIAIGLIGVLAFWCGILKLAEYSGLAHGLAKLLAPLFSCLMPSVPKGHPALGYVTMNMASNMLGLDNAATPMGLKAMQSLQELNQEKDVASDAQILFLVLNTSSVTIFPITIIMYRLQQGASSPAEVFLPILLATLASSFFGLVTVTYIQRINIINRVLLSYFAGLLVVIGSLIIWLHQFPAQKMADLSAAIGNGLLFSVIIVILLVAHKKKVEVYEGFVEGAKEGFSIAIKIIPYMVAMLVAIGILRASGVLQILVDMITKCFLWFGFDTGFVEALPTAIMRPFSASGSRAMMLETMSTHGADSFVAKVAAVMQGSTETTFYVLTVYFGSVGIKKVRHAIGCGLFADFMGIVAAIFVCYWFFI
jgi:spore maturation protein SpmA